MRRGQQQIRGAAQIAGIEKSGEATMILAAARVALSARMLHQRLGRSTLDARRHEFGKEIKLTPFDPRQHWEEIYRTRDESGLSWFEDRPEASLDTVLPLVPDLHAAIVDVGGGTSRLVDLLLGAGCSDITVLDISKQALELSRQRLAERAGAVKWVQGSVLDWHPAASLHLWHDRAVYHFFTAQQDREAYVQCATRAVSPGGFVVIDTFAPDGPSSCSGLPVYRAEAATIAAEFGAAFRLQGSSRHTHVTPGGSQQNFQTVVLERL